MQSFLLCAQEIRKTAKTDFQNRVRTTRDWHTCCRSYYISMESRQSSCTLGGITLCDCTASCISNGTYWEYGQSCRKLQKICCVLAFRCVIGDLRMFFASPPMVTREMGIYLCACVHCLFVRRCDDVFGVRSVQ